MKRFLVFVLLFLFIFGTLTLSAGADGGPKIPSAVLVDGISTSMPAGLSWTTMGATKVVMQADGLVGVDENGGQVFSYSLPDGHMPLAIYPFDSSHVWLITRDTAGNIVASVVTPDGLVAQKLLVPASDKAVLLRGIPIKVLSGLTITYPELVLSIAMSKGESNVEFGANRQGVLLKLRWTGSDISVAWARTYYPIYMDIDYEDGEEEHDVKPVIAFAPGGLSLTGPSWVYLYATERFDNHYYEDKPYYDELTIVLKINVSDGSLDHIVEYTLNAEQYAQTEGDGYETCFGYDSGHWVLDAIAYGPNETDFYIFGLSQKRLAALTGTGFNMGILNLIVSSVLPGESPLGLEDAGISGVRMLSNGDIALLMDYSYSSPENYPSSGNILWVFKPGYSQLSFGSDYMQGVKIVAYLPRYQSVGNVVVPNLMYVPVNARFGDMPAAGTDEVWFAGIGGFYKVRIVGQLPSPDVALSGSYLTDEDGNRVVYGDKVFATYQYPYGAQPAAAGDVVVGVDEPQQGELVITVTSAGTATIDLFMQVPSGMTLVVPGGHSDHGTSPAVALGPFHLFPLADVGFSVTPTVAFTTGGGVQLALNLSEPLPTDAVVRTKLDGADMGDINLSAGETSVSVSIPQQSLGTHTFEASVCAPSGLEEACTEVATATVEWIEMFRPALNIPVVDVDTATIAFSVNAPKGRIHIVDISSGTPSDLGVFWNDGGVLSASVMLPVVSEYRIYAYAEYGGYQSQPSNIISVIRRPPRPVLSGPSETTQPDIEVEVTASEGQLSVMLDGTEVISTYHPGGTKAYALNLGMVGRHEITAVLSVNGIESHPSTPLVVEVIESPGVPGVSGIPDRTYHREITFTVNISVSAGYLDVFVDGVQVEHSAVKPGDVPVTVRLPGRGYHDISVRVCSAGGVCGEAYTKRVYVYDFIEMWIGRKDYMLNGQASQMDVAPFIDPTVNRTMVPLRFILEGLGFEVMWDGNSREITITGTVTLESGVDVRRMVIMSMPKSSPQKRGQYLVYPGSPIVRVSDGGGRQRRIDMRNFNGQDMGIPFIYQNRTYVPVRFISEIFGANVGWDSAERKVTIER